MHPERVVWLLWPALIAFSAIYGGTLLLLARAVRQAARPEEAPALRRGHLVVLRPQSAGSDPGPSTGLPSHLERRRRGG